jgi:pSer/pThr/pTyr-binding forkhead associated (FHA) protein
MLHRRLVITRENDGDFILAVNGNTLTIGNDAEHPATVQPLRVVRIHCEVEAEGDGVTVQSDDPDQPVAAHAVCPGEVLHSGGCRIHFEGGTAPAAAAPPVAVSPPAPALGKRLFVIDGGNQGQAFPLPSSGTVIVGRERKHADIALHDLYVARVHCRLEIEADEVVVIDENAQGTLGTFINGKKISRRQMGLGDILRVGNSHLRLQAGIPGETFRRGGPEQQDNEEEVIEVHKVASTAADDEDADGEQAQEEAEPLPAGASEGARQLHTWRGKELQLSGQAFGHYKVGPLLGRGRGGQVFRAEDAKTGQALALKVLAPQFPQNEEELQRFTRVVKGLLALRHPNLVTLLGAGKTGIHTWIAREYVDGDSVARLLCRLGAGRRPDIRRACRIAVHVGRALDFARKNRLRHGQVTPANILVRHKDHSAKLADLMMGTALMGSHLWRATQEIRPTAELAYLSPEQSDPGAFVDELSDLYGLGAVLFALLTGRPPFVADAAAAILEQVRGPARAVRPSTLNPAIPAPLEQVVLKLLAKRQEDRYQTPAELLADLEPIAAKQGVEIE